MIFERAVAQDEKQACNSLNRQSRLTAKPKKNTRDCYENMLLGCSVSGDVWLILLYINIILSIYLYQIKCWTNICRSVCVYKYNLIIINTAYNQIKCWINIYYIQMNEISIKPIFLKCITPACPIVMRSHGTLYLLILTADSWSNNCFVKKGRRFILMESWSARNKVKYFLTSALIVVKI